MFQMGWNHQPVFGKIFFFKNRILPVGGGFSKYVFNFQPEFFGEWIQFDYSHILQMGWWETAN